MWQKIRDLLASNPAYTQLFRFVVLGVASVIAELALLMLFNDGFDLEIMMANRFAFAIVLVANYWLSRVWVFGSGAMNSGVEFLVFLLVSLVGLGINEVMMPYLIDHIALDKRLAKILTIGLVVAWNFTMKRMVVFKKA
jgi:putative flippase GtrA